MKARVAGLVSSLLTSPRLRERRRRAHALRRRLTGAMPTVHYFHGAADPYSHLAAQLLPALAARYAVDLRPHIVPAPVEAVAPDSARLAGWSLRDAARLAAAHGLAFPASAAQPSAQAVAAAESALAGLTDAGAFAATARAAGDALWSGGLPMSGSTADRATALAEGARALSAAGHYLPGVFAFEGECYWGIDRLPHLEARLSAAGLDTPGSGPPVVAQLEAGTASGNCRGAELHVFLSFRSPYTYIAAARVRALAARWNATLYLRLAASMPSATASMDFPVPIGPARITSSPASTKPQVASC